MDHGFREEGLQAFLSPLVSTAILPIQVSFNSDLIVHHLIVAGSYDRNRMKFPDNEQQLMDQVRQLRQRVVNDGRSESR